MSIYLEISPRQTGKTTRLLKAAYDWKQQDSRNDSIVCTVNESTKRYIQSHFGVSGWKIFTQREIPSSHNHSAFVRWFYDDFDFYKLNSIDQTGYYTTTPRFIRREIDHDDLLQNLVVLKKGHWVSCKHKELPDWTKELSDDKRLTEGLGLFGKFGPIENFSDEDIVIDELMRSIGYEI